jgi:hypothetical protein
MQHGGSIVIGKHGWQHVAFHVSPEGKTLAAKVSVAAGPWSGACDTTFLRGELSDFAHEIDKLHETLHGRAVLAQKTTPNIDMTLSGDGKGHITAVGSVRADFAHANYIAFELTLEPAELLTIAEALRAPSTGAWNGRTIGR